MIRPATPLKALALVLLLAGCQTDIYSGLTEREANLMLAALLPAGIDARKVNQEDGIFQITVPDGDVQQALAVLDTAGLPRSGRSTIGQVFARSGIVSSPFEERVRYIYALGEEVAATIEQIDGVLTARVHIVMPEAPELGQEVQPSSAAVFMRQRAGFDLDFLMPQVRRLVANAIEGVSYEEVSVVLVEAAAPAPNASAADRVELVEPLPGLRIERAGLERFYMMAGAGGALLGLMLLALGFVTFKWLGARKRIPPPDAEADYG
ncbi:MAG: type III secretion system inner membrane ring lipoprotein SctJ [Paracoccaceae bacterium]